jgi:uncharacterized protein (TIGR02118 family)
MGGMSLIKIVFCLARLPALSVEEFHAYWRDQHAPLVREAAPLLRIRRYTQSRYFSDPRIDPAVDARGCKVGPFDGVAELWWDIVEDIIAAGSTREGRAAGRGLLADEKNFIDLPNSAHFFTREDVIIAS